MGLTLTAKASFDRTVNRMTKSGELTQVKVEPGEYSTVPDGEKRVRWTGYSDPFQMTGEWGEQTKVRCEFLVLEPKKLARQRFDTLVSLTVGEKATLGKIYRAAMDIEFEVGQEASLDDALNQELYVFTEQSESKGGYTNINIKACRPVDDDDQDDDDEPAPTKKAMPDDDDEDGPPY